jgi:hypothetical protein
MSDRTLLVGGLLLVLAAPASAIAQAPTAFIARLGNDTLVVERYVATPREIQGTSVVRAPRTTVRRYTIALDPSGAVARVHITSAPAGGAPAAEADYHYFADSVVVEQRRDTAVRRFTAAVAGRPLPLSVDLFAGWELAIERALPQGEHPTFQMLAGRRALDYQVVRGAGGVLDLINPSQDFGPLHARVDAAGRLQQLDLRETTDKYLVDRVADVDVDALAASFAERDRAGHGLGMLSPRDTARGDIAGARVMVDYGRPSVRGRVIFGGKVAPWNVVWRLGANEATQLITDRDLTIGDLAVPAGTYSLFAVPAPEGWTLIINKQHGQWGTIYDQAQDLGRVPMTVRSLPDTVERLTIAIRPQGAAGAIVVDWAQSEATVPLGVVPRAR